MTGQQYPTREQIAARLTGDIFDAVPDDNDMQHVLTLAAAILSQPTPSAEATVLVPVSLIERAAELLDKHHPGITSARLRAVLFPQPTPSAEPERSYTAADVQEAFERGCIRGEQDANERNWSRRQYEKMQASLLPAAPPSIADMTPGCGS